MQESKPGPPAHPARFAHFDKLLFRTHALFYAALCFALGVAADRLLAVHWQTMALRAGAVALLLVVASVSVTRARRAAPFAIGAVWVMLGWACAAMQPMPAPQTALQQYADGLRREIVGVVTRIDTLPARQVADSDTSLTESSEEAHASLPASVQRVDLAVSAVEDVTPEVSRMVPIQGAVRFTVDPESDSAAGLQCGDTVHLTLRLRMPQSYRDPGVFQYPEYLAGEGVGVHGMMPTGAVAMTHGAHPSLACKLQQARASSEARVAAYTVGPINLRLPRVLRVSADDAGTFNAMLFGDRAALQTSAKLDFQRTGSFHLLVVAGMHVGLVAIASLWLLTVLRCGRTIATLSSMLLTVAYAVFTGFGLPVQRALWMTLAFLLAYLFARRRFALNALGIAALAILAVSPSSLFESGFQMTVLAVVAVIGIAIPMGERTFLPYGSAARSIGTLALDAHLAPRLAQFRVALRMLCAAAFPAHPRKAARVVGFAIRCAMWALELLLLSVVAEVLMSLPMMIYFHRLTPLALPANLFCVVLMPLLMVACSLMFALSCVWVPLAVPAGLAAALLLHAMTAVLHRVSTVHAAEWRVAEPSTGRVVAMIALIALALWMVRQGRRTAGWSAVVLACFVALLLMPAQLVGARGGLEITAIDVGQGDAILVVGPQGKTMLIDAGGPVGTAEMAASASYDVGEEVVSPYLWHRGIDRIDVMVLTHAHSDHMGGMPAVMRNFHPRELWIGVEAKTVAFQQLMQEAKAEGVTVRRLYADDLMPWDATTVQVLSPSFDYVAAAMPKNDDSLVLRMVWERSSLLLEGDAEAPSEREMVSGDALASTVLKVGHHGSRTSSTQEFLSAVSPQYALISDGRDNHFGHPRMEVLERLQASGVRTLRTDMLGAATLMLDREGRVEVAVQR